MESTVGAEKKIFNEDVPFLYLSASLQCLLDSYVEAFAFTKHHYRRPEFRYLYPHMQRATFEGNWRRLAKKHGGRAAVCRNSSGDCHTRCRFGRVVITQSGVNAPGEFPRQAEFRETIAADQQMELFDADPVVRPGSLYAIVTHGPRRLTHPVPAFLRIGFPARDATHFVDYIDLTPLLVEAVTPPIGEPVPDDQTQPAPIDPLVVRLRGTLKVKKEGA